MKTMNVRAHAVINKNAGIAREWTLCAYYGVTRTTHDHIAYDKDSDLNVGDMAISIKASGFTLMSGRLCAGCKGFDDIWNRYEQNVHSNTFVYISKDYIAYSMNLDEFKTFIYSFCYLDRESKKNGGGIKIKCRAESQKMLRWLEEKAAA